MTVVDIGAGEGTYSDLMRGWRDDVYWIAVECWSPYIREYELMRKYDDVVPQLAQDFQFPTEPFVLLCGDVLEHMPREEAIYFLYRARQSAAEAIMVAIPIIEYPQEEIEGNPYEKHCHDWDFEEMAKELPGCETWIGDVVGRYWWTP
jgi:2-polyprenyl-3-methyl-5-hydroxy-6-metoxy-1,4-benzoquinol methylase